MGIPFSAGSIGEQTSGELVLAEKVAQELGVAFRDYSGNIQNQDEFDQLTDRHFSIANGVPALYCSSSLIDYYEQICSHYDLHITGYEGSELLVSRKLFQFPSGRDPNVIGYSDANYPYRDLLKTRLFSEEQYRKKISRQLSDIIFGMKSDDPATLLLLVRFASYSKFFHGSLIGVHDSILPHYSPYFEENFMRLMIASSQLLQGHEIQKHILFALNPKIAALPTSHGYTAIPGSGLPFIRKADFWRFRIPGMARLDTIKRKIFSKSRREPVNRERNFWKAQLNANFPESLLFLEDIINRDKVLAAADDTLSGYKLKAKLMHLSRLAKKCGV